MLGVAELPQHNGCCEALDRRIKAKPHERDRSRGDDGSDGDHGFDDVPGDGEIFEFHGPARL